MGPIGNGAQGVWCTRDVGHMGNESHGQWDTGGMGHMGNRGTGGMGYKGYGPHRQWDTWAVGYRGMGNGAHGQFAPKISKRCQVVKKMSSCQKDVKCQKMKHLDCGGGSQKN